MAVLEEEKSKKEVVAVDGATTVVKELRESFASGKTRSYEWRISQLRSLLRLASDHEQDIAGALRSDLSKPEFETIIYEVPYIYCSHTLVQICSIISIKIIYLPSNSLIASDVGFRGLYVCMYWLSCCDVNCVYVCVYR